MRLKSSLTPLFAVALLFISNLAFAQENTNRSRLAAPTRAEDALRSSISFTIPTGGNPYASGALGYWYLVTNDINIGFNVGMSVDTAIDLPGSYKKKTAFGMVLAPTMKYYFAGQTVKPFVLGQISFGIKTVPDFSDTKTNVELSLIPGFGVEWFVVNYFSLSGYIGLSLDLVRQPKEPFGMHTFTSNLAANIYF